MGFRQDIIRSKIFNESSDKFNEFWFSYKLKKFLPNVDTLYYTVSLKDDYNKNPEVNDFIYHLSSLKSKFLETKNDVYFNDKLLVMRGRFDDIYEYRLTCPDKYDIFITSYLPNKVTPRIAVQLRSSSLWIDGIKETIEDSYSQVLNILSSFNLHVGAVYENRLDYCYHTNYVQDMYSFFSDNKMKKKLKTNMPNWRKDGKIFDNGWELNYFALGSRKSNNTFIRIYDKTREVTELSYKGFFILIWFNEGLINGYDKYILEYCYNHGNFEKRYEGMLHFYSEHGSNNSYKKDINYLLKDTDRNFYKIKELALSLMPQITTITNIEFQTKRKFYSNGDDFINGFEFDNGSYDSLDRLFKIIDNRKVFLNYLTHYNLRFVDKDGNYLSWWKRLRGQKIGVYNLDSDYVRNYQRNLDKETMIKRTYRTIATTSLYKGYIDSNLQDDIVDYLCSLNDNDMIYTDIDYKNYKEKKYQILKNQLNLTEISDSI